VTERVKAIDEAKLRSAGVDALSKALGPLGAVRFLALFRSEPTDYVEVSRRLYEKQNVKRSSGASRKTLEGIERKTPPAIRIPRPSEPLYNQWSMI